MLKRNREPATRTKPHAQADHLTRGELDAYSEAIEAIEGELEALQHVRESVKALLQDSMIFTIPGGPESEGVIEIPIERLADVFRQICATPVADDGLVFGKVSRELIRGLQEYGGIRLHLSVALGRGVIPFGVDVGFGDPITPPPKEVGFPTLFDFLKPKLRASSRLL